MRTVLPAVAVSTALILLVSNGAIAQTVVPGTGDPGTTGTVIQRQPNTTGNSRDIIIAPGATGAETITTDSAAGSNARYPERAVPNGSAGSSGGDGG